MQLKKRGDNVYSNLVPKISKTLGKCSHSFSGPVASFSYSNIHQYHISKHIPYTPNANLSSFSVYFSSPSVSNSLKLCDSWAVEPSSFWRSLYESFPSASSGAFSNSFWRSAKRTRIEKSFKYTGISYKLLSQFYSSVSYYPVITHSIP